VGDSGGEWDEVEVADRRHREEMGRPPAKRLNPNNWFGEWSWVHRLSRSDANRPEAAEGAGAAAASPRRNRRRRQAVQGRRQEQNQQGHRRRRPWEQHNDQRPRRRVRRSGLGPSGEIEPEVEHEMEIQRFRLLETRAQVKRERNADHHPHSHSGSGSARDLARVKTERKQDCELLPQVKLEKGRETEDGKDAHNPDLLERLEAELRARLAKGGGIGNLGDDLDNVTVKEEDDDDLERYTHSSSTATGNAAFMMGAAAVLPVAEECADNERKERTSAAAQVDALHSQLDVLQEKLARMRAERRENAARASGCIWLLNVCERQKFKGRAGTGSSHLEAAKMAMRRVETSVCQAGLLEIEAERLGCSANAVLESSGEQDLESLAEQDAWKGLVLRIKHVRKVAGRLARESELAKRLRAWEQRRKLRQQLGMITHARERSTAKEADERMNDSKEDEDEIDILMSAREDVEPEHGRTETGFGDDVKVKTENCSGSDDDDEAVGTTTEAANVHIGGSIGDEQDGKQDDEKLFSLFSATAAVPVAVKEGKTTKEATEAAATAAHILQVFERIKIPAEFATQFIERKMSIEDMRNSTGEKLVKTLPLGPRVRLRAYLRSQITSDQ